MKAGQREMLHFHLLLTPFHPIDYRHHWNEHIYHVDNWDEERVPDLEKAKAHGATMINLHQGGMLRTDDPRPRPLALVHVHEHVRSQVRCGNLHAACGREHGRAVTQPVIHEVFAQQRVCRV